jgi:lipopolysaccharide transport system ATP-binding protein
VRCERAWKRFRRGEHHDSLRDFLPALLRRGSARRSVAREFWALRDVSFEVRPGEALGVIGPNGAGKSTLLKVLTRILRPTHGTVHVRGRQGVLIEVAAGFHQDLTGRENLFLQGAIMGMSSPETGRKFDQIVEFAGVTDFIDPPVKRSSSGMNARLGFAIAAHLDPEVLFVDEVLAVGDLAFQQKAYARMRELVRSGIPVVMVSHQLDRIAELCTHALLLDRGTVVHQGTPQECIAHYLDPDRGGFVPHGDAPATIERLRLEEGGEVCSGDRVRIGVCGRIGEDVPAHIDPVVVLVRNASTGALVSAIATSTAGLTLSAGPFSLEVELQMNVPRGIYLVQVMAWDHRTDRPLGAGPSLMLPVSEGVAFFGPIQLNGRMSLD